jgi:transcriptional regulator of acetoin/glycerol metabolism
MKHLQPIQEILSSWRICIERGVLSKLTSSTLCLEESALETKQKENKFLLSIFNDSTERIDRWIKVQHCFLLISPEEILLKKNWKRFKT